MNKKNMIRLISTATICFFVIYMMITSKNLLPDISTTLKVFIVVFLGYLFIILYEIVYMYYKKKIRIN